MFSVQTLLNTFVKTTKGNVKSDYKIHQFKTRLSMLWKKTKSVSERYYGIYLYLEFFFLLYVFVGEIGGLITLI